MNIKIFNVKKSVNITHINKLNTNHIIPIAVEYNISYNVKSIHDEKENS